MNISKLIFILCLVGSLESTKLERQASSSHSESISKSFPYYKVFEIKQKPSTVLPNAIIDASKSILGRLWDNVTWFFTTNNKKSSQRKQYSHFYITSKRFKYS